MVTSNMDVSASASEGSGRSGVCVGDWSIKDPCYKVAKKLRIVSCSHMEEKVSDKRGYLAEEISKQSLEVAPWLVCGCESDSWSELFGNPCKAFWVLEGLYWQQR